MEDLIDLTEDEETLKTMLFFLLDNPHKWRQRSVERIKLSSAAWSERERITEVLPLLSIPEIAGILGDRAMSGEEKSIRLILPVTLLPRVPVIDLSIAVADIPVHRIPGVKSGKLQADYILHLISEAGVATSLKPGQPYDDAEAEAQLEKLQKFLAEMFGLAPGPWRKFLYNTGKYGRQRTKRYWHWFKHLCAEVWMVENREYRYLKGGLKASNLHSYLTYKTYDKWNEVVEKLRKLVRSEVPPYFGSVSENPLIALPEYFDNAGKVIADDVVAAGQSGGGEVLRGEVYQLLDNLHQVLDAAAKKAPKKELTPGFGKKVCEKWRRFRRRLKFLQAPADVDDSVLNTPDEEGVAAQRLVATYAGYGRRWELLVDCVVPLNKAFTIKMSDRRAIYFEHPRKGGREFDRPLLSSKAWQWVVFKDAVSNHVYIRVTDTNVELGKCKVRSESGKLKERITVDQLSNTAETFTTLCGNKRRVDRIWIKCPLRPAHFVRSAHLLILGGTLAALATLLWISVASWSWWPIWHHNIRAQVMTVLLVPTTFAVSLILVRESSTLSGQSTRRGKTILSLLFAALWILAFGLIAFGHVKLFEP
ncbi:hypothetical protein ACWDRB_12160 [Nonomuraea sp. NPDC003707]